MSRHPRALAQARKAGRCDGPFVTRCLRTAQRDRVLRPHLARLLAEHDLPFLDQVDDPAALERASGPARRAGDPLSVYWADLKRLRPTQREEEFVLTRAVRVLRDAIRLLLGDAPGEAERALVGEHLSPYATILQELQEAPAPTRAHTTDPAQRRRLGQRLRELQRIQEVLIARNLHAVPSTARKYRHVGVPWEDLIQEGNAALMRAVERYEPDEGVRFAGYAGWWIQQGILKALSFQSRTVRLPVYLAQALHRVRDAQAQSPHPLTVEQLAERTQLPPERVARALKADRQCVSLQRPAAPDEDGCLADFLPDQRPATEPDAPAPNMLRERLEELLTSLPEREALVLRLRFGLEDGRPWTLEEVRQRLGVSRERVRQLQAQSLGRLSRPTPRKELARFL